MRVLVCVKHVPVDLAQPVFDAAFRTDRSELAGHLGGCDRAAVAAAAALGAQEVVAVTMGPENAADGLAMAAGLGASRLVHVVDGALAGSDTAATSLVLAAVARRLDADLVVTGVASDDGASGFVPAQVAARLARPLLGRVHGLRVEGCEVVGDRPAEGTVLRAPLPAVASVVGAEAAPAPGAPAPAVRVEPWRLRDLGIEPVAVGRANAWSRVETVMPLEVSA